MVDILRFLNLLLIVVVLFLWGLFIITDEWKWKDRSNYKKLAISFSILLIIVIFIRLII